MKKPKTFHSKLETLRYETIPITFHLNFVGEKLYTILSVSVLSVSVSADMKIIISVFYRYRPIKKKAYRSYTASKENWFLRNIAKSLDAGNIVYTYIVGQLQLQWLIFFGMKYSLKNICNLQFKKRLLKALLKEFLLLLKKYWIPMI